jgi:hypothetical protein
MLGKDPGINNTKQFMAFFPALKKVEANSESSIRKTFRVKKTGKEY